MQIFNLNNRPYLVLTNDELLFRDKSSDEDMRRHRFDEIEKISLESRYNAKKELFLWLKVKMLSQSTPLLVQVSFLDTPIKELLLILSKELEGKVVMSLPTEQWIDRKISDNKKIKRTALTISLLLLGLFIVHKTFIPSLDSLNSNALEKKYDKSYGLCSTKARVGLKSSDEKLIEVKTYCGILGTWKETDTKYIPRLYLETEFSSLKVNDYILQANQYYDQNQTHAAKEQIDKALYLSPNNIQAYLLLTRVDYKLGDKEKALSSLKKAASINPNSPAIASALSIFYIEEKKYAQAYPYAKKAVELEANSINFIRLAQIEQHLEKWSEAIKYFERSLYENPDNAYVLNQLGMLYWQTDQTQKAAKVFKKAYEHKPDQALEFLNYYEVSLVTPTPLSETEKKNFLEHYQDSKEKMIVYDMLSIIHLSIENRDTADSLAKWKETYQDNNLQWSFKEIRIWLDNNDLNVEHKQHIQNTIGFFIGHQRAYKMRSQTNGVKESLK